LSPYTLPDEELVVVRGPEPGGVGGAYRAFGATLKGLRTTFARLLEKPVTIEYPEEKRPVAERFRGRIYLKLETCIGCTLCAQACPNGSCYMVDYDPGFDTPQNKRKKFPAVEISKCMYCSLCEEACPTDSIRMGKEYETAAYVRDFDYKPDRLSQNEAALGRGPFK
jgi:NADH-quinone oxidoreductase subunit I